MRQREGLRREPRTSTIPTPRFTRHHVNWNPMHHTGGPYSLQWNLRDMLSRNCIPENSQTQMIFNAGASTSRPKCVCEYTVPLSWINEVEMARSTDDVVTSQSIEERRDFPDFEMLDARIASALRRIISNTLFRRKSVPKSSKLKNTTDS